MWAWFFGATWMYIVTGATWTQYAKLLDMPLFGYGLFTAIPAAAALLQIPVGLFLTRRGGYKSIFIIGGLVHRFSWLVMALVPWMVPHDVCWIMLLVFTTTLAIGGHISTPAWFSWMAEIVPSRIRGRFFSRRTQMGQFVGLVVTLLIGLLLDQAGRHGAALLLKTVSTAIAIAGFVGLIDILFFTTVPSPPVHPKATPVPFGVIVRQVLADRNFMRFSAYMATVTFAMNLIGQFVWLYLFDVLHASNTEANIIMMVIPMVVLLISIPLWGRMLDRFGRRPVVIIAGIMFVPGSLAWFMMTRDHWVLPYLVILLSVSAWPGIDLSNFNYLLSMNENSRRYSALYVALNSVIMAMAILLSGVCSGIIAEALKNWHSTLWGIALSYHSVLFLVSFALRFLALGWLIGFKEHKSLGTRAMLLYMGNSFSSNLQGAVTIPIQIISNVGRWTYKLGPFGKKQERR